MESFKLSTSFFELSYFNFSEGPFKRQKYSLPFRFQSISLQRRRRTHLPHSETTGFSIFEVVEGSISIPPKDAPVLVTSHASVKEEIPAEDKDNFGFVY
ncbi:hypothetical protein [Methanolobus sp.]|uniref:hypothetical protein n=1 Tax=Methanolobus sp. TaxID=1874737 RepID=UPI0025F293DC|nr:hypothetical protein [Methanolobus sp.]